jgi:XRE family transcriptional regulator, regulator of sulfur utilization
MSSDTGNDDRSTNVSALQAVSGNLQKWRVRRRMSVSALARAAGVSKSTVSELERHSGNPSLDTLWALARALEIPLGFLFTDHGADGGIRVVRAGDGSVAFEEDGYVSHLLAGWEVDGEIEFYATTIDSDARHDSESHGTSVIEHTLVVDGRVEIGIGGETLELGPGDLVSFPAAQPHHYRAVSGPARLVGLHQYPRGLARIDTAGADEADAE